MTQQETQFATIKSAIRILCVLCAGDEDTVVDLLTGHLWDEEEAGGIKSSSGKFEINI